MATQNAQSVRQARARRRNRVRARIAGTDIRPRLAVFRSLRHITAQLIDDAHGRTLATAHDEELKNVKGTPVEKAAAVGMLLADRAREKKITTVVFDRREYQYHGRVKALADGVRKGGITF